jgi:hypothetical protein
MKITIDTNSDSHQDIKKVIRLLSHLIGEESNVSQASVVNPDIERQPDVFSADDTDSKSQGGLFNMFESSAESDQTSEVKEEEKDDLPEVIAY